MHGILEYNIPLTATNASVVSTPLKHSISVVVGDGSGTKHSYANVSVTEKQYADRSGRRFKAACFDSFDSSNHKLWDAAVNLRSTPNSPKTPSKIIFSTVSRHPSSFGEYPKQETNKTSSASAMRRFARALRGTRINLIPPHLEAVVSSHMRGRRRNMSPPAYSTRVYLPSPSEIHLLAVSKRFRVEEKCQKTQNG
ncbi:hypothetical protein SCHPADRAFT_569790 [Schizopora paradoxa]|uniref:Uncharacterized protein n=1 Tax=Schizopora paradoxa TaxID=27342 RepID=A0A0H2RIV0_9AGAM|nr:hypothetical protein SCHPADRAFT_569790 [Schizopora paradoxa]